MIEIGFKDILDILLVAVMLYYIYRVMKETSSARIFSGIIFFLIVWIIVSQVFEMRLLGSILDKVVNVGGLALIILFQEEIRRFFSTLGTHRKINFIISLFRSKDKATAQRSEIMPIVMACMSMSKHKEGALIVLERSVQLGDMIRSGDEINADINQRLIENIFFKNSPLHDGAMIIKGKRIRAAGCILPVSHDIDIPKSLGLRHRAALGVSQKTDAIAIIVSEETGGISVAMSGQFRLRLTAEELERIITDNWV